MTKVIGSYSLLERLGLGGMGEVWRAQHQLLKRQAAVKLIRPTALAEGDEERAKMLLKRFEREAQTTSQLECPHTIQLYDFGTTDEGTFYYVMELLDGLDLRSVIERFGPLPAERTVHLLLQACESLEEGHLKGLVHRDVKPANLFLCHHGLRYDFVKVLDFGLVKPIDPEASQLTADGTAAGSPAFMAPEIAKGDTLSDARSDIYAMGCVAYWLLTGQFVFEARTPYEVVLAHMEQEPEPPSVRTEMPVPESLDALILSCLAKSPSDRPADMHSLRRKLASCDLDLPWTDERALEWWRMHLPDHSKENQVQSPRSQVSDLLEVRTGNVKEDVKALTIVDNQELSLVREEILDQLQHHFAVSHIDVDEYERRAEIAQRAGSPADVRALILDLPEARPEKALVPLKEADMKMVFVFGSSARRGLWRAPSNMKCVAVFGGGDLDFREAQLGTGITTIKVACVFGGIDVIVPPDLPVDVDVQAVFGGVDQDADLALPTTDENQPRLRITGAAVFGGVNVKVKKRKKKRKKGALSRIFGSDDDD